LFPTAALLYIRVGFSMFGPLFGRLGDNYFYLLAATVALILDPAPIEPDRAEGWQRTEDI
jgi:hypothetical protein